MTDKSEPNYPGVAEFSNILRLLEIEKAGLEEGSQKHKIVSEAIVKFQDARQATIAGFYLMAELRAVVLVENEKGETS